MGSKNNSSKATIELTEYFGDLYGEIAYENSQQLHRQVEKMQAEHNPFFDPFSYMQATLRLLIDEIGYIKADIGQLRLESLSRGLSQSEPPLWSGAGDERIPLAVELPQSIEIAIGGFFSGRNWHNPEINPDDKITYRWSGPGDTSTFDLMVDRSEPLVCELEIGQAFLPEMLEGLTIYAGETLLQKSLTRNKRGRIVVSTILPAVSGEIGSRITVLKYKMGVPPQAPSSADSKSNDHRPLGILAYKLRVFPESYISKQIRGIAS